MLAPTCEGCGDCCDPVLTTWDAHHTEHAENRAFARAHWHELPAPSPGRHRYQCDAFDPATRCCTAYATRPPVCRGFPWYGAAPSPALAVGRLPRRCVYWRDIEPSSAALTAIYGDSDDYYGE